MAQIILNTSSPNDNLGDDLRDAFISVNSMMTELYSNKVDKVAGKGLSSNDFTDLEQVKLTGIESGAEVNVQSDLLQSDDTQDDFVKGKDSISGVYGLIKIVDILGEHFTTFEEANAYVTTFTSATLANESFNRGIYSFTVPIGTSFALANNFLQDSEAYVIDEYGMIDELGTFAFFANTGNNVIGNCQYGDSCFKASTGINKFKNIRLSANDNLFAENSSGRFEIYGNIGVSELAQYTNFFIGSTAVIWADKSKQTSNSGGVEGDLLTAETNGAELFFGYTDVTKTSQLINDGSDGIHPYITLLDLPSNLILYPTNVSSDVVGYLKLVTDIHDPEYNVTAVDISTPTITGAAIDCGSLITAANLINGNPGVFNISMVGNIRRLSGSGTAEFYFKIYKRDSLGTETLVGTSNPTLAVNNGTYAEFNATAVWDDGIFTETDRVVLKLYANRITGGSDPVYQFQFGGVTPVRALVPIPLSVVPVSGLSSNIADYTTATTPLAGTEMALVEQGGTFKKVAVSEFGGATANKQIFQWWGGNWNTTTLGNYYYIGYSGGTIEGLNTTILASMNGRNKGLFIAPYNCKIKRVMFKEAGSGSYTGAFVLASGLPVYGTTWNFAYTNRVTHIDSVISSLGYNQNKFEYLVTDDIVVPKGYAVCPMLIFSAQAQANKTGIEISIEIEEDFTI